MFHQLARLDGLIKSWKSNFLLLVWSTSYLHNTTPPAYRTGDLGLILATTPKTYCKILFNSQVHLLGSVVLCEYDTRNRKFDSQLLIRPSSQANWWNL